MAISLDSSSKGHAFASTLTIEHQCSGSSLLVAGFRANSELGAGSATYNGITMTLLASVSGNSCGRTHLFYLANPPSGTYNVVFTGTASGDTFGVVASYIGAGPVPNASDTEQGGSAASITTTLTTTAKNCWAVMVASNENTNEMSAGTNAYKRVASTYNGITLFDTNGVIASAGEFSMTATVSAGKNDAIMAALAPIINARDVVRTSASVGGFMMY